MFTLIIERGLTEAKSAKQAKGGAGENIGRVVAGHQDACGHDRDGDGGGPSCEAG